MINLYVLPNLLTTGNLFFGFYSIVCTLRGDFTKAAWVIFIAMLMDILDGRIARITNTTSMFGLNYDSLADLVSFGMAPSLLIYEWALSGAGRVGWLIAFLFVACGALRLARFNVLVTKEKSNDFLGFPIPAAAGLMASYYLFADRKLGWLQHKFVVLGAGILMVSASLLMVSKFRYFAMKGGASKRGSYTMLVAFILAVFVVASDPHLFYIFGLFCIFLIGYCESFRS